MNNIQMNNSIPSAEMAQNPLLYVSGGKELKTYLLIINLKLCQHKIGKKH